MVRQDHLATQRHPGWHPRGPPKYVPAGEPSDTRSARPGRVPERARSTMPDRAGGQSGRACCFATAPQQFAIGSDRIVHGLAAEGDGRACLSAPALAIGSNYASESHAGMFVWQDPFPSAPKAAVSIRPLLAARKAVGCSRCTAAVPLHDSVRVVDAGEPTLRR